MSKNSNINDKQDEKWDFSDYAFTITGIIVAALLVVPDILYSSFGIIFLGGSLGDIASTVVDDLEYGTISWDFLQFRALSPLLFLLTTTIVFFQEAIVARKDGGYKGSLFTHTFESLLEDTIYMAITTVMVYSAALLGAMYISWLAGPITWVMFVFLLPIVKKKGAGSDEAETPWLLLTILAVGLAAELATQAWVAFPLSWLVICAIKFVKSVRKGIKSIDALHDMLYYAFSVVLMSLGIFMNFWITSWIALPLAIFICWIASKLGMFKATAG